MFTNTGRRSNKSMDHATRHALALFERAVSHAFDIRAVILFGSRARDDHRGDSDADVAVLVRGRHQDFLTTKLAMADVAYDVLLETGIRIQPLPVWEDEWEHPENYPNPRLLANIHRDGIPL
jgi:predicted nucleotidyltransferase